MRVPSRENSGSDSSASSWVSRRAPSPPAACCTQISRLPSPDRSEAYATSRPSGDTVGYADSPGRAVSCFSTGFPPASDGPRVCQNHTPAASAAAATAAHRRHPARLRRLGAITGRRPTIDSSCSSSRSGFKSSTCWMRRSGSLQRHCLIRPLSSSGTSGASSWISCGSLPSTAASVESAVSPRNGRRAVVISYRIAPNEKMSDRQSTALPSACSGDMYAAVPTTVPSVVSGPVFMVRVTSGSMNWSVSFANPKSRILTSPFSEIMMLAGFRSR